MPKSLPCWEPAGARPCTVTGTGTDLKVRHSQTWLPTQNYIVLEGVVIALKSK